MSVLSRVAKQQFSPRAKHLPTDTSAADNELERKQAVVPSTQKNSETVRRMLNGYFNKILCPFAARSSSLPKGDNLRVTVLLLMMM